MDLTTSLKVDGLPGGTTLRDGHAWVDPVLGLVLSTPLGERWSFSVRTDVAASGPGLGVTVQF